jgi:hypothetical protein
LNASSTQPVHIPGMEPFVLVVIGELEVPFEGVGVWVTIVALLDILVNVGVIAAELGDAVGNKEVGVTVETKMVGVFPVVVPSVALDIGKEVEVEEELTASVSASSS